MYLKADLEHFDLKSMGQQFDVILLEPPLEEYARSNGVTNVKSVFEVRMKIVLVHNASVPGSGTGTRSWP